MKIGIIIDPIDQIKPEKDTSLAIMRAAQNAGAEIYCMEEGDMFIQNNHAYAMVQPINVHDDNDNWYSLNGGRQECPLADMEIIFMRKDPPVNKRFIHTTYILGQAEQDGVYVVNPARSLREFNEKIFATDFATITPPYVIGADQDVFQNFLKTHNKIVMKPLDGMGGEGVFLVEKGDVNFGVIWETLTNHGKTPIMAQSFIPDITTGDKRIIIIDGVPFQHMLVRLPKKGSIRGNLAVSGDYEVRLLSDADKHIAEIVGKRLKEENILLAGIDVIGEFLTEVNITSPTGFCQIANASGEDPAEILVAKAIQYAGASSLKS